MPRAFLVTLVGGLLVVLLAAVLIRPSLAFTLGVTNDGVAVAVPPGHSVCQRPIAVPPHGSFDRVRFSLGTYFRPGPPIRLRVLDDTGGQVLGSALLRGGYPDIARAPVHTLRVGEIDTGRPLRVCLANEGDRPVAVYGAVGAAHAPSSAYLDGRLRRNDLNLAFERAPRSLLSALPVMAERASLFRPGWVGPWTYGVALALVAIAVPALLALSLAGLRRE